MFRMFKIARNLSTLAQKPASSLTKEELAAKFPKTINAEALSSLHEEGLKFVARIFPDKKTEEEKVKALLTQYPKKITSKQLTEAIESAEAIRKEGYIY